MAEKKTKKAAPKRTRKPKQGYLSEDMAPVRIAEIDEAAENYVSYRDARMASLREEIKSADKLLELMKTHNLPAYEFDGKIVEIGSKEKIKVRRMKDEGDAEA